jgi:hypothetical protein
MDGSVDKFEFNNGTLNWTAPHQAGKADCIFAQQS